MELATTKELIRMTSWPVWVWETWIKPLRKWLERQHTPAAVTQFGVLHPLSPKEWLVGLAIMSLELAGLWFGSRVRASRKRLQAATASDPGLLRKHSTYESYTTRSGHTYPRIRTFFKEHTQAAELPKDLPLLVCTHGLGGSASQFAPLLTSLINLSPCLAIDLPGCGLSSFEPNYPKAYTTHALAELVAAAISRFRNAESDQKVILVGHSMGCAINTLLSSSTSPLAYLLEGNVIGTIAICPRGTSFVPKEASTIHRLRWLPISVFDVFRWHDRRGGLHGASVTRMVGKGADDEARALQMKFNEQSQSEVFLRMIQASVGPEGWPGKEVWSGIKVPLFLVGGEADTVTPAREVEEIAGWLSGGSTGVEKDAVINGEIKRPPVPSTAGDAAAAEPQIADTMAKPRTWSGQAIQDDQTSSKHSSALKVTVFPDPAAHGLLYSSSTVRILSGMIENFLSHHVDQRLGIGWQLQHLSTSGKWDVKNLKKWQAVDACSEPIGGVFRAMKTMREVDEQHCPTEFVKRFNINAVPDGVAAVIDISHESPVYHPRGLEDAGIEYVKFPTVSKEKPKAEEVDHFIGLIDEFLSKAKFQPREQGGVRPTIGVHCHYGFNRTGFFIVCYLVERLGYRLQDAIEEFEQKRPPGIKHDHFVNELFVRYAVKMQRRITVEMD